MTSISSSLPLRPAASMWRALSQDCWADPENEYLSCIAAGEYYRNMGLKGFIRPDRDPVPGDCFGEGEIGYHLRAGTHYLSREDWGHFMEYMRK